MAQNRVSRFRWIEFGALAAFTLAAAVLGKFTGFRAGFLTAYAVFSTAYSVFICVLLARADPKDLPRLAARHDERAIVVLLIGLTVILTALAVTVGELMSGVHGVVAAGLVAGCVFGSWIFLNTIFAVHYAHRHFSDIANAQRETVFPGDAQIEFSDFLYFSFVIGMTFQVSDVAVAGSRLRRIVLAHAVLAFLLNVFVLSLTISIVGDLI